jgi:hypothetical protein
MKNVDRLALWGLLVCAILIGAGLSLSEGNFTLAGSYFGYFLGAYSFLRYLVQTFRLGFGRDVSLWGTLIPVNFALSIIGVAIFGIHDSNAAKWAVIVFVIFLAVGILISRTSFISHRFLPAISLGALAVPFYQAISPFWSYVYLAIASLLLAIGFPELMQGRLSVGVADTKSSLTGQK